MFTDIFQQWLATQCASIPGAHSGMVTLPAHGSQKSIVVRWPSNGAGLKPLLNAAQAVLKNRQPLIQTPRRAEDKLSTHTVVATPIQIEGLPLGAASLSLDSADTDQGKLALKKLNASIPALGHLFQTAVKDEQPPELEMVTGLLATALTHKRFKASVTALATELASLLECDRVSIGLREVERTRLVGISHNVEIKPRQALIRALSTVMDEAIDQAASIQFPENPSQPPRITLAHKEFAEQFKAGSVCTVPLFYAQEPVGALLLERPADRPFTQQTIKLCEHLASFLAPVLQMKFRLDQPWPKRLLAVFINFKSNLFSRKGIASKALLVMLLAGVTLASLPIAQFKISAPAQLEGAIQRMITAANDGYIKTIHARPGDNVSQGQVLIELEDRDLRLQQRELQGELAQFESAYGGALASRDRTRLAVAAAEIEKTTAQLALIEQKLLRIQLKAPFDGIVILGDLSQTLGAPVKRGDKLMTIAPAENYRVVFDVDERDIGYLKEGQTGRLVLSSNPSAHHRVQVERITPMASAKEGRNTFAAEAIILDAASMQFRPGLKGLVKIDVEQRSLLWVALHRSWSWMTFKLWSWTGYA
jgi:RND family efflux transporter MFP subunit